MLDVDDSIASKVQVSRILTRRRYIYTPFFFIFLLFVTPFSLSYSLLSLSLSLLRKHTHTHAYTHSLYLSLSRFVQIEEYGVGERLLNGKGAKKSVILGDRGLRGEIYYLAVRHFVGYESECSLFRDPGRRPSFFFFFFFS